MRLQHSRTPDGDMDRDMQSWVPEIGSARTQDTKYYKLIDLYRHMKTLMGHALIERNQAHNEILLQLDEIQVQLKTIKANHNIHA